MKEAKRPIWLLFTLIARTERAEDHIIQSAQAALERGEQQRRMGESKSTSGRRINGEKKLLKKPNRVFNKLWLPQGAEKLFEDPGRC